MVPPAARRDQEQHDPGGPKWLIVRTSLDAKIEEEKVIEAALKQKTGSHQFEPVRPQTSSNQFEPVYDNQLVKTLAQQIIEKDKQLANAHSREIELTKKSSPARMRSITSSPATWHSLASPSAMRCG